MAVPLLSWPFTFTTTTTTTMLAQSPNNTSVRPQKVRIILFLFLGLFLRTRRLQGPRIAYILPSTSRVCPRTRQHYVPSPATTTLTPPPSMTSHAPPWLQTLAPSPTGATKHHPASILGSIAATRHVHGPSISCMRRQIRYR